MSAIAEFPTIAPTSTVPVPVQDLTSIIDKTVFLKCRFGCLGNSRKVSNSETLRPEVMTPQGDGEMSTAPSDWLAVSKKLLASPELDAIKKADGKMRQWLYANCLPYDLGVSLLPIGLVEMAESKLVEYKAERQELVETFITAYPALCASAAETLGSLYNPLEYPGVDVIRAKFVFDWQYISFSTPGTLKGISSDLFKKESEKAAKQMQAAAEEITLLMRQTLHEMVSHLAERLTPGDDGKAKKLHASAVTNLQEFLSTFDFRNITNDQELAAEVEKARALVNGISVEGLRKSDKWKESIASGMASISGTLSLMVEEQAGRKFRDE